MAAVLRQAVETLPPHQTEVFLAVLEQLRWFAGLQIRNVAVSSQSINHLCVVYLPCAVFTVTCICGAFVF